MFLFLDFLDGFIILHRTYPQFFPFAEGCMWYVNIKGYVFFLAVHKI